MAYSTQTDILNWIPAEVVKQLTDDNDTDEIDTEKLDDCIRRAADAVDSWLQGRFAVPVQAPVPGMINDVSTKLTVYFLYKRGLSLTIPEPVQKDYDEALGILREIQRGRINPFPQQKEPVIMFTNKQDVPRWTTQITNNWASYPQ